MGLYEDAFGDRKKKKKQGGGGLYENMMSFDYSPPTPQPQIDPMQNQEPEKVFAQPVEIEKRGGLLSYPKHLLATATKMAFGGGGSAGEGVQALGRGMGEKEYDQNETVDVMVNGKVVKQMKRGDIQADGIKTSEDRSDLNKAIGGKVGPVLEYGGKIASKVGKTVESDVEATGDVDPYYEQNIMQEDGKVNWKLLSDPAFIASKVVGQTAQMAPGLATGPAGMMAYMGAMETGSAVEDFRESYARNHGIKVEDIPTNVLDDIDSRSQAYGIISGALESMPIASLLKRIGGRQAANSLIKQYLVKLPASVLKQMVEEGTTESIQQLAQNIIATGGDIDPNRPLSQGVAESGITGAVTGGGMGIAGGIAPVQSQPQPTEQNTPKKELPELSKEETDAINDIGEKDSTEKIERLPIESKKKIADVFDNLAEVAPEAKEKADTVKKSIEMSEQSVMENIASIIESGDLEAIKELPEGDRKQAITAIKQLADTPSDVQETAKKIYSEIGIKAEEQTKLKEEKKTLVKEIAKKGINKKVLQKKVDKIDAKREREFEVDEKQGVATKQQIIDQYEESDVCPSCVVNAKKVLKEHPEADIKRGIVSDTIENARKLYSENKKRGTSNHLGGFTHIIPFVKGEKVGDVAYPKGGEFFSEEDILDKTKKEDISTKDVRENRQLEIDAKTKKYQKHYELAKRKKEEYVKANAVALGKDHTYTPNVAGRNNAKIKRMHQAGNKYSKLSKREEYWRKKYEGSKSRKAVVKGDAERAKQLEPELPVGTKIDTGYRLEGRGEANIVKNLKKSYKIEFSDGKQETIKKSLVHILNKPNNKFQDKNLDENQITEEEVKQQIAQNPILQGLTIKKVKALFTPEGMEAWGKYKEEIITYAENPDKTTLSHEAFHAFLDLLVSSKKTKAAFNLVRKRKGEHKFSEKNIVAYKEMSDLQAEEVIAQEFAEFFVSKKRPTNKLEQYFAYLIQRFKDLITGADAIDRLFTEAMNPANTAKIKNQIKIQNEFKGYSPLNPELFQSLEKDGSGVTLKTLKRISEDIKKPFVNKQALLAYANRGDIKQAERDLIKDTLDTMPDGKVSVKEFNDKVKAQLVPLTKNTHPLDNPKYESVVLSNELRGDVVDYIEHLYESPIKTSAGNVHFQNSASDNYFAHSRLEDMADNKTRRVIEVQSDLFQKGNLEKELLDPATVPIDYSNPKIAKLSRQMDEVEKKRKALGFDNPYWKEASDKLDDLFKNIKKEDKIEIDKTNKQITSKLQPYRNTYQERIIKEELKQASLDGIQKLQFPTGETAMKIEGLGDRGAGVDAVWFLENKGELGGDLAVNDLKTGITINRAVGGELGEDWIITEVLQDGKFKAVPKDKYENLQKQDTSDKFTKEIVDREMQTISETFDISGKVDTKNPIYRFYEKDIQKYLRKIHPEMQRITDKQGVEWFEINPTKEEGDMAVEAFQTKEVTKKGNQVAEITKKLKTLNDSKRKLRQEFIESSDGQELIMRHDASQEFVSDVDPQVIQAIRNHPEFRKEKSITDNMADGYLMEKNGRMMLSGRNGAEALEQRGYEKIIEVDSLAQEAGFDNSLEFLEQQADFVENKSLSQAINEALLDSDKKDNGMKYSELAMETNSLYKHRLRLYKDQESFEIGQQSMKNLKNEVIKVMKAKMKAKNEQAMETKKDVITASKEILKDFPEEKKRLLATIKNAKNDKDLQKATEFMESLKEKALVRKIKSKIKKELKSINPKKVKGRPVGKFTPKVQKILDIILQTTKMTKESALELANANVFNSEGMLTEEQDLQNATIKAFFGGNSEEAHSLLKEIQGIKETGSTISAIKAFNEVTENEMRNGSVIDVITGGEGLIDDSTAQIKDTTMQKIKKMGITYFKSMQGFDNILDILSYYDKTSKPHNSLINKEFDMLEHKNYEKNSKEILHKALRDMAFDSFGFKKEKELLKKFQKDSEQKVIGTFKNAKGNTVTLKMSVAEARKRYMEFQDKTLDKTFTDGMSYTAEIQNAITGMLSAKDKKFALSQLAFYKNYYKRVNKSYEKMYGVSLPFNESYSPIRRRDVSGEAEVGSFLEEQQLRASITTGSMKDRVRSIKPLADVSDVAMLQQHIVEMEHFISHAEITKKMYNTFKDVEVRKAIRQRFGGSILKSLDHQVDNIVRGGRTKVGTMQKLERARLRFVKSVLAGKISVGIKQLTSFIAYSEKIPVTSFAKNEALFWKNPIKNAKELYKVSTLLRNRGDNMERDIKDVMNSSEFKAFRKSQTIMNRLMLPIKLGDQGAIVMGGWPVYKHVLDGGKVEGFDIDPNNLQKEAVRVFEKITEQTQQSGDITEQSFWQSSGTIPTLLTMFMSSQNQYFRKEADAIRGLVSGRGSRKQHLKTLAIYHVILPTLFQFVANGFTDDDDDREYLWAMLLGSFNGIFVGGQMLEYLYKKATGERTWGLEIPLTSIVKDFGEAFNLISDDKITEKDLYNARMGVANGVGKLTGTPLKTGLNIAEGVAQGNILQTAGWSPYLSNKK